MVVIQALTALLAFASPLLVRADMTPSEPSPGSSFNVGTTCRVTWQGDKDSESNWKKMAIQLMSGDNLNMVHITTVTTDLDGTKDGKFEYPCPDVSPYSAIYFYQFSSPNFPDHTWTTRFTIASSSGDSVPPANNKQPDGDNIPWGVGNLVDTSKAVPPPAWVKNGVVANSTTGSNSTTSASSTSSRLPSSTSSRMLVSATSKADLTNSTGTSAASGSNSTGAALGLTAVDSRVWIGAVGAFAVAALL